MGEYKPTMEILPLLQFSTWLAFLAEVPRRGPRQTDGTPELRRQNWKSKDIKAPRIHKVEREFPN